MQLQLALDRISIDQAIDVARQTEAYIDIIEVGTSLIKDYGLRSVREIKKAFPNHIVLADIKTIDEGAYEFHAAFKAGADMATVMAAASIETLEACYQVSRELGKQMMIDILEEGKEKINRLKTMDQAIFCIHASTDQSEKNVLSKLIQFKYDHPTLNTLAIAGGITLEDINGFKNEDIHIAIIGSSITKARYPDKAAQQFHEEMH